MRVVALDLSLRATGIAQTHDRNGEPRLSCRTAVTAKSPDSDRPNLMDHRRIALIVEECFKALRSGPELVLIESPIVVDLGDHSLRLAELHGLIKHVLYSRGIPYVDVHLTHVKQYATGKGNADKEVVLADLTGRYSKRCTVHIGTYDEADAFSMLALGLHAYGQPLAEVPQTHLRALNGLSWPKLGDT